MSFKEYWDKMKYYSPTSPPISKNKPYLNESYFEDKNANSDRYEAKKEKDNDFYKGESFKDTCPNCNKDLDFTESFYKEEYYQCDRGCQGNDYDQKKEQHCHDCKDGISWLLLDRI